MAICPPKNSRVISTKSGMPRMTVVYTPPAARATTDCESLAAAVSIPSAHAMSNDSSATSMVSSAPLKMNGRY